MVDEIINEREQTKLKFLKKQSEKFLYLGEFKENIIIAVNKSDIEKNFIYDEVFEAMKRKDANLLKIRRDIKLEKIKVYIKEAENIKLRYTLVDDLSFRGDVGLVVVSKEELDNDDKDVILESKGKVFIEAGLSEGFAYAMGKKICPKHFKELEEKLPEYTNKFEKMNFFDRLFGKICIIDEFEEKERKK